VDDVAAQTKPLTPVGGESLDVARFSEKRIDLRKERIDLGQLVQRTIQDYQSVFIDKHIVVSTDLPTKPIWLDGDPMRLSQAIGNLLDNAAKFSIDKGKVRIAVCRDDADVPGSHAVITVEDTGIGIHPGILQNVFDPLVQADTSLRRGPSGLGLGLSLVKGIVELHGGQVEAFSEGPGKGARFTIRLPLAATPESSEPPEPVIPLRARSERSRKQNAARQAGVGEQKGKPRRRARSEGKSAAERSEDSSGSTG